MAVVLRPAGTVELPAPPANTYFALTFSVTTLGKAEGGIFFQFPTNSSMGLKFGIGYFSSIGSVVGVCVSLDESGSVDLRLFSLFSSGVGSEVTLIGVSLFKKGNFSLLRKAKAINENNTRRMNHFMILNVRTYICRHQEMIGTV